jgi:hypothetical protein
MQSILTGVAMVLSTMGLAVGEPVTVTGSDPDIRPPVLLVQCRNVRERLIRADGRVEYVTRQDCGSAGTGSTSTTTRSGSGCQVVRERVIRQNGQVDYQFVNRCF